jgi:hypothetical protein
MTLILGMSKPEGIYLSVDYRITNTRTHELIDDASIKNLTIHYPPLDGGPKALVGFTGIAILPDGTPIMTWVRETLRGESEVIDQSMAHLRSRLDRDVGPYIARLHEPLMINFLVLEKGRRLFGGFTNVQRIANDRISILHNFAYTMQEVSDTFMFANGSGAAKSFAYKHISRLQPHLNVIPREPINHMKLLAVTNRRVAARENTVSPFCHVSFIPSGDRFEPTSRSFVERGESAPFGMSIILAGIDLTGMAQHAIQQLKASRAEEAPPTSGLSDVADEAVKRRP